MACADDVMDQEAAFLTALQTPAGVEVNGANVTLRAASGATQVVFGPKIGGRPRPTRVAYPSRHEPRREGAST